MSAYSVYLVLFLSLQPIYNLTPIFATKGDMKVEKCSQKGENCYQNKHKCDQNQEKRTEKLSRRDVLDLMSINRQTLSRGRGGAYRQR